MTGFDGERADVAEAEHRGAVGDDADEVAAARVLVGQLRRVANGEAGLGDAGGVRDRQVGGGPDRLRGDDRELARLAERVVAQRPVGQEALAHGGELLGGTGGVAGS